MGNFNPKEVFREARDLEKRGKKKAASAAYSSLGMYLRKRNRPKDAKHMIERAIKLSPDSPRLYVQLALCEIALNDDGAARRATELFTRYTIRKEKVEEYSPYLEAQLRGYPGLRQVFYEALLTLDRTDAQPFLRLAQSLMEQAQHDGAQKILLDALKTKTHEAEVLGRLKQVLELRRDKQALQHLDGYEHGRIARNDLIALLSGGQPVKRAPASAPLETEKNLQDLIEELEQEIGIDLKEHHDSINPLVREFRRKSQTILEGDTKSRIDMALAFFEMGLIEDARDELKPIAPTDAHYLEAQFLLGDILYSERSDLGALEVFQQCLRDDRVSEDMICEARYKLMLIFYRLGDHRQAFQQAEELENRRPGYRDTRRYLEQIQESLSASEPKASGGRGSG